MKKSIFNKNKIMKALIIAASLLLVGCTADETDYLGNTYTPECGTIVATGEDNRGDYIEVKMPHYSANEKDRYKVSDYQNYDLNSEICNFAGLTKQSL